MSFQKEILVLKFVLLIILLWIGEFSAKPFSDCEDMGKDEIVRELDIILLCLILVFTQIKKILLPPNIILLKSIEYTIISVFLFLLLKKGELFNRIWIFADVF